MRSLGACIRYAFIFALLLCLPLSFWVYGKSATTTSPAVSALPSSIVAGVGQNFAINIAVAGITDLYGWQANFSWDPTLIDVILVEEGPFLKSSNDTFFSYNVNATLGYLVADCTLLGLVPGVSGGGVLTFIDFHVKAAGECLLSLSEVILVDTLERLIPCETASSYGYFLSEEHDLAVADVQIFPMAGLAGESAQLNVTVQNHGEYFESFQISVFASLIDIGTQNSTLDADSSVTVSFDWNTTGCGKGEYTILAVASVVAGETDVEDNNRTAEEPFVVLSGEHDVGITSVRPSKTAVGYGYTVTITVTTRNYGLNTENFGLGIFANDLMIQTQGIYLASGGSDSVDYVWATITWEKYLNYTISARADILPDEVDTADNIAFDGTVYIGIPGDVNPVDGYVGVDDIFAIASHFGQDPSSPSWDPNCDINGDEYVGIDDVFIAAFHFGEETP